MGDTDPGRESGEGAGRVQRIIREGAEQTTLDDLQKRGFRNVRVINEEKIRSLIGEALETILAERSKEFVDEERRKISQEAMNEFQEMMADHQAALKLQDELFATQNALEAEYSAIAGDIANRIGDGHGEELGEIRGQFASLLSLVQEKDKALVEKSRELQKTKRKLSNALEESANLNRETQGLRDQHGALAVEKDQAASQADDEIHRLRQEKRQMETALEDAREVAERATAQHREVAQKVGELELRLKKAATISREEVEALKTDAARARQEKNAADRARDERATAEQQARAALSGLEKENLALRDNARALKDQFQHRAAEARERLAQAERASATTAEALAATRRQLAEREQEAATARLDLERFREQEAGHQRRLAELEQRLGHYRAELTEMQELVDGFVGALAQRKQKKKGDTALLKLSRQLGEGIRELDEDQREIDRLQGDIPDETPPPPLPPAAPGGTAAREAAGGAADRATPAPQPPPAPDAGGGKMAVSLDDFDALADADGDEG
ncbi:MAG: hypothetical protein HY719_07440 [Planctomycetes bacterium]|nr:hypothetical protein [Planctomycetota bacterium]